SYERIHRSNLVGMGVVPLEFPQGESASSLGLDGEEVFSIDGLEDLNTGILPRVVEVSALHPNGHQVTFEARVRIDTETEADYYRHGGVLQFVLRQLAQQ
ncbi:MAG: aconitate hydratase, partial [Actinomycetes bacterium]